MRLVFDWTSSTVLRRGVDRADLLVGRGGGGEEILHLAAERRQVLAVIAHVLQIRRLRALIW